MTGRRSTGVAVLMAVLLVTSVTVVAVGFAGTAAAESGSVHVLGGEETDGALRITVEDGNVQVYRYDDSSASFVRQYYSGDDSETVLYVDGELYDIPGGGLTDAEGITLSATDQYTTDGGSTVVTEFETAGDTGVELVQRISYSGPQQYFDMTWEVTNTGSEPVENVRLLNGKDTYLAGGDSGYGFWDSELNTIGVRKTVDGEQQRLSMRGITEPDAHQSNKYWENQNSLSVATLTNEVRTEYHDNGYSLEWRRSTLGAGETWTVEARESFTRASIVVTGPGSERLGGDTVDLEFDVENVGAETTSVSLVASGPEGWDISSPSSLSIEGDSRETVTVTVDPPEGAAPGSYDVTLTASTEGSTDAATGVVEVPGDGGEDVEDPRPSFRLVDRSVDDGTVQVGETAVVTAVVENQGAAGTYRALVSDRDRILHSEQVTIGPDETRTLTFPVSYQNAGEYALFFDHRYIDDLIVEERPPDPLDAERVAVRDPSVSRSTVAPGESYEVTAVVENTGNETGLATVEFAASDGSANSTTLATRNVTLEPGESGEVTYEAAADELPSDGIERTWLVGDTVAGGVSLVDDSMGAGVIDAYTEPETVAAGEEYDVVAVVHNPDDAERLVAVNFGQSDGEMGSLRFVSVGPGETRTVARTVSAPEDAAGTSIHWWVNDLETAVAVEAAD